MKRFNKSIALISTGCIALMSVAPMYSSAHGNNYGRCGRPEFSYRSERELGNYLKGFEKVKSGNRDKKSMWGENVEMFYDRKDSENVYAVENVADYVWCKVKKNVTEKELEKALEKFNKKHKTNYHCHKNSEKHGLKHKWDNSSEEIQTTTTGTEPVTEVVTTATETEPVTEAVTTVTETEPVTEAVTTATETEPVTEAVTTVTETEPATEAVTTVTETETVIDYEFNITVNDTDVSFTMSEAKELYDYLKSEGLIEEFVYNADASMIYTYASKALNYYSVDYDSDLLYSSSETIASLLSFVVESMGVDYTIQYIDDMVALVSNGETDIEEQLKIAEEIYDSLGLYPYVDISCEKITVFSDSADMANSVENDANNDGVVTMSDSVSVLQSLSNPEKYGLTNQGKFNCDAECEGITPMTALNIQNELTEK